MWSFANNASSGTLGPANGAYRAGATGSVTDTILVTDNVGNTATATIAVGAGVTITPKNPTTYPNGDITFVATGGSGTGYVWALTASPSGGSLGPTGAYHAGGVGPSVDSVKVTDSLGNVANVDIAVGLPLTIEPGPASVPPRGKIELVGHGGTPTGHVWAIDPNESGGTVNTTGVYVAGPKGDVHDTITLTDAKGTRVTYVQAIGHGVTMTPHTASVGGGKTLALKASGGSDTGFLYAFARNDSGGTIDGAKGVYGAGAKGGVKDIVVVTDSLGNEDRAEIEVLAGDAPGDVPGAGGADAGPGAATTPPAGDSGTEPKPQVTEPGGCRAAGRSAPDGGLVAIVLGVLLFGRRRRSTSAR